MDEEALRRKLAAIEALFAGATSEGERVAAQAAQERLKARLQEASQASPPEEYRFTLGNEWSRRLFVALVRRYGLRPYRYSRQRHTTVMVRVSKEFSDQTLWPQFEQLDATLTKYLDEVVERVIREAIHQETGPVEERPEAPQLGPGGGG